MHLFPEPMENLKLTPVRTPDHIGNLTIEHSSILDAIKSATIRAQAHADWEAGGRKFLGGSKGLAGSSKGPAFGSKKLFSTSAGGGVAERGLWRPGATMPAAPHLARMGRLGSWATRLFRNV